MRLIRTRDHRRRACDCLAKAGNFSQKSAIFELLFACSRVMGTTRVFCCRIVVAENRKPPFGTMLEEAEMKGDDKVIQNLNETLKNELTAVNQYWLHYRMLDNWGVKRLAEFERHESIDEMKHADRLAERILFLEGLPNLQMLGRLRVGENVEEILRADLELEREAVNQLKD